MFVLLALFFDLKIGFWVAMGVPVSMLGTGALMFAGDQTLNMLSMFAFLMAVGIDVDDAIVVSDNVERHRKMGKGPRAGGDRRHGGGGAVGRVGGDDDRDHVHAAACSSPA